MPAGDEEEGNHLLVAVEEKPGQLPKGVARAGGVHPQVGQQLQAFCLQKDHEDDIVEDGPGGQIGCQPQSQIQRGGEGGFRVQGLPQDHQQRQGDGCGDVGLISPHGQGQGQHPQQPAGFTPLCQPHRQHRQQDGQTVGRGGEQIQKGVSQAGEGSHHRAGQTGQHPAADLQQIHHQGGGQPQKEQGQQADDGGHLGKLVQGGGVVQEPTTGDGHLLEVEHPAQSVGVGNGVGKGVQVDQIAGDKAAEKGGSLGRGDPAPQPAALLIDGHRNLLFREEMHTKFQSTL